MNGVRASEQRPYQIGRLEFGRSDSWRDGDSLLRTVRVRAALAARVSCVVLGLLLSFFSNAQAGLIGEWRLDTAGWDGSPDEISDSSGGGHHGRVISATVPASRSPVRSGNPGTCGYASQRRGAIQITGLPVSTRRGAKTTVAFWMRWDGTDSVMPIGWSYHDLWMVRGTMGFSTFNNDVYGVSTSGLADDWHHVVAEFTNGDVYQNRLYIDGVERALSQRHSSPNNTRAYVQSELRIGGSANSSSYQFQGDLDEVRVYNGRLTDSHIVELMNETHPCEDVVGPVPVAEWRMDESRWTGAEAEVADASGNGHAGSARNGATTLGASPVVEGDPGTCRYSSFDGTDDFVSVPWSRELNPDAFSVALWARVEGGSGSWRSPFTSRGYSSGSHRFGYNLYAGTDDRWQFWTGSGKGSGSWSVLYGPGVRMNAWVHVAATFEPTGRAPGNTLLGTKRLFIDGQEVAAAANVPYQPMRFGTRADATIGAGGMNGSHYRFIGNVDEVQLYSRVLGRSEIRQIADSTHPCDNDGPDHFVLSHDGEGVHCAAEPITLLAADSAGTAIADYQGTVTLDTQSGKGTWSLVNGAGRFVDATGNDGLAAYTFSETDAGVASFSLTYVEGESALDLDAYEGSARDDDTEGPIQFSPSKFVVTAEAVPSRPPSPIADPIATQVAGSEFKVHLAAYGTTPDNPTCGVVESYAGRKALSFWSTLVDPNRGTVVATIDGASIPNAEGRASEQDVTFVLGRAMVTAKYKDVGLIQIAMSDAGWPGASAGIRGATNAFVSRPASLKVTNIQRPDGSANPQSETPEADRFVASGSVFGASVRVIDAEGSLTPNYGRESSPEGIRLVSSELVAPPGGRNGTLGDGAIGSATDLVRVDPAGTFKGEAFSFDEVGAIRLQAAVADDDYMGTGPIVGAASEVVGRFIPDRFEVTSNIPRFSTGCDVGAFTWVGEPFGYRSGEATVFSVRAVNAAGTTTANYAGSWWRITNASLANRNYAVGGASLDTSGLPGTSRDPTIGSHDDGTGTLTFSTGSGLAVNRNSLLAPFDAEIELSIDVLDGDGVAWPTNPFLVGGTTSGSGISFDVAKRFQFGRLRIENSHGTELVDRPVPLRTQFFDGAVFVDDGSDSCSRVEAANLIAAPEPAGPLAPAAIANVPMLGGEGGLSLAAPRTQGFVDVVVDLGPAGANLPWLQFDWAEDGNLDGVFDDNPQARVTFGIWEGRDFLIFTQEVH